MTGRNARRRTGRNARRRLDWSEPLSAGGLADGWLIESAERYGDRRAQIFSPSRLYPRFTLFFPGEAGEDFDTLDAAQRRADELLAALQETSP